MRSMTRSVVAATALLALACAGSSRRAGQPPAVAEPAQDAAPPAATPREAPPGGTADALAAAKAPAPTKVVCRTERPTGSNIAKRVCWREEDLEAMRLQAQDFMRRAMQQASAQGPE